MGVKRVEELIAFQLARNFKRLVYDIVRKHPEAHEDFRYRNQLWNAASGGEANIDEGFQRFSAKEFNRFLTYARSSLSEAKRRLRDGADRGYFPAEACEPIEAIGGRAIAAVIALQRSLTPFMDGEPGGRSRPGGPCQVARSPRTGPEHEGRGTGGPRTEGFRGAGVAGGSEVDREQVPRTRDEGREDQEPRDSEAQVSQEKVK